MTPDPAQTAGLLALGALLGLVGPRLPLGAQAAALIGSVSRARRSLGRRSSDHWKERALRRCALLTLGGTVRLVATLAGLLIGALAALWLLDLVLPGVMGAAHAPAGMALLCVGAALPLLRGRFGIGARHA